MEGTRQDLARDQMVETLRSSFILPEIISKNIGSYNLEERSVNYFVVKASDQKAKDFTDLEINEYFKKNKADFKTKEFRDVETLLLDAKKFAENTTVTEDEVQILYEERKESLIKPERRYLKQILVQEEDVANKIALKLEKGTNFSNVAKELASLDESDIDLGWNTKTELPEEVIEEVFNVKKIRLQTHTIIIWMAYFSCFRY